MDSVISREIRAAESGAGMVVVLAGFSRLEALQKPDFFEEKNAN